MRRIICTFLAFVFMLAFPSNYIQATDLQNNETIHVVELAGETFRIAKTETENGLTAWNLVDYVSPDKMYLAEIAMEIVSNPNFDPYAPEVTSVVSVVDVTNTGVEYYKRVTDEPPNLHSTTMATYESNNASYSNYGYDTVSSDCSAAWYGTTTPSLIKVEHIITFNVTNAQSQLELSYPPSGSISFETTYKTITINYSHEVSSSQLVRINGADAVVHHSDLQGGYITNCVSSTRGSARLGDTLYNARAEVKFMNYVN